MRKILLLCLLTVCLTAFQTVDRKSIFSNGRYLIDFTTDKLTDYEIEIIGDKFIKRQPNFVTEGKIIQIGPSLYHFKNNEDITKENSSEIGILITKSFGEHCVEVKKVRGNKIFFRTTYAGNLNITANEGVFIKKKEK